MRNCAKARLRMGKVRNCANEGAAVGVERSTWNVKRRLVIAQVGIADRRTHWGSGWDRVVVSR